MRAIFFAYMFAFAVSTCLCSEIPATEGCDADIEVEDGAPPVVLLQTEFSSITALLDKDDTEDVSRKGQAGAGNDGESKQEIMSMIPDNELVCYQGPPELIRAAHEALKLSIMGPINYGRDASEALVSATCASLGYTVVRDDPDDCWAPATKWVRDLSDGDLWGAAQRENWALLDAANGWESGTAMTIGGCTCLPGYRCTSKKGMCERGVGVLDSVAEFCSETISSFGFDALNGALEEAVTAVPTSLAQTDKQSITKTDGEANSTEKDEIMSMIPDNELVCYQGPPDLIRAAHEALKLSTMGPIYGRDASEALVSATCASLGYTVVRDDPDDCWAPATKWVRDLSDGDLWGAAQGENWASLDAAKGWESGTAIAISGCTCLPGYRCPPVEGMCERDVGVLDSAADFCSQTISSFGFDRLNDALAHAAAIA